MNRKSLSTFFLLVLPGFVLAVGKLPVPDLSGTGVETRVQHEEIEENGKTYHVYNYEYIVTRPETDKGKVARVRWPLLDEPPFEEAGVAAPSSMDFHIFFGSGEVVTFKEAFERRTQRLDIENDPRRQIRVGQKQPEGWNGAVYYGGVRYGVRTGASPLMPGETKNFEFYASAPPTIRDIRIEAHWMYVVESDEDWDPAEQKKAAEIEREMEQKRRVIGPTYVRHGSAAHWQQFRGDLEEAVELQWISEFLGSSMKAALDEAWKLARSDAPWEADPVLAGIMEEAEQGREQGTVQQGMSMLLYHNARILREELDEEPPPPEEPGLSLNPDFQKHGIGGSARFEGKLFNRAEDNAPLPSRSVRMEVVGGPHEGLVRTGFTTDEGRFEFGYHGEHEGVDRVHVTERVLILSVENEDPIAWADVEWQGGPDLVPARFRPVYLEWDGEFEPPFLDVTINQGNLPAGPSTTRFYISGKKEVDPETATPVVERRVPELDPGERHEHDYGRQPLPEGLEPGTYFLRVCVDADDEVAELDETNNCDSGQLMMVVGRDDSAPAECELVDAEPEKIWPPNHQMEPVSVSVKDPALGDDPAITVTAIQQDEPVEGRGDGSFEPDGDGVGTDTPRVRAERSGRKNGRIYEISLEASGNGSTCESSVIVSVPHDRRPGGEAQDSGERFDSTAQ